METVPLEFRGDLGDDITKTIQTYFWINDKTGFLNSLESSTLYRTLMVLYVHAENDGEFQSDCLFGLGVLLERGYKPVLLWECELLKHTQWGVVCPRLGELDGEVSKILRGLSSSVAEIHLHYPLKFHVTYKVLILTVEVTSLRLVLHDLQSRRETVGYTF